MCWNCPQSGIWPRWAESNHSGWTDWHSIFIDQIRQYAIHWLSTNVTLSLTEKILLARAHRVGAWLDEGVTGLATCNPIPTLEDLATLGWETAARFLWLRSKFPHSKETLNFRRDSIKCSHCSSSSSLINDSHGCGHIASGDAELTFSGSASLISGTTDRRVVLRQIQCPICKENPFISIYIQCKPGCSYSYRPSDYPNVRVRVSPYNLKTMIEKMFGEEIKDHKP